MLPLSKSKIIIVNLNGISKDHGGVYCGNLVYCHQNPIINIQNIALGHPLLKVCTCLTQQHDQEVRTVHYNS